MRAPRFFQAFILATALTFGVAGCAQLQNAYNVVTGAQVSPQAVVVAASTFDAFEVTATNYLRLRRCTGSNGPICRDPAVTPKIIAAVRAGRVARNNLKAFLRAHPGQLGPTGDYDALIAATQTLQQVLAAYQNAGGR